MCFFRGREEVGWGGRRGLNLFGSCFSWLVGLGVFGWLAVLCFVLFWGVGWFLLLLVVYCFRFGYLCTDQFHI